jgi:hypothetical protein
LPDPDGVALSATNERLCWWCGGPIKKRRRKDTLTCSVRCRVAKCRALKMHHSIDRVVESPQDHGERVAPPRVAETGSGTTSGEGGRTAENR